jgi:hypothetical protein
MGHPLNLKCILSKWGNDCSALVREKYKITWFDWSIVPVNEKETLWELIKAHYVFLAGYNCYHKFYVQPGVSPLNRFGFITPNK